MATRRFETAQCKRENGLWHREKQVAAQYNRVLRIAHFFTEVHT